ncbi:MAG: dihydroneopterin aldolase [Gammaproteobacteria bacterium]|nr:dihydroneopterin aldolase [Gammaproteobacteria bacterium]
MDIVFINQLTLNTIIGIHDWEREKAQPIILDIDIGCSTKAAAQSDQIKHCVDYFNVCERMKTLAKQHSYQLVESFAEEVSQIVLNEFKAQWVRVKLSKPAAVKEARGVGILIERQIEEKETISNE